MPNFETIKGWFCRGPMTVWIVGPSCSGKTHMSNWLAVNANCAVFHTGVAARQRYGDRHFADHKQSALAPDDTEAFVLDGYRKAKEKTDRLQVPLLVDSMPRRKSQLSLVRSVDIVLFLWCYEDIRMERIDHRCQNNTQRKLVSRATTEYYAFEERLRLAVTIGGTPVYTLPNNKAKPIAPEILAKVEDRSLVYLGNTHESDVRSKVPRAPSSKVDQGREADESSRK